MPSFLTTAAGWVQRKTGWSNSREAWLGRLGLFGWLAAGAAGYSVAGGLGAAAQVLLAAFWLLLLAVLLRRGWLRLFGPVLFYELVRLARQRRNFWMRTAYAVGLAVLFTFTYLVWTDEYDPGAGRPIPLRALAKLAESFFDTYMVIQFLAVGILTPAYVAGAIAEEKERKTLEFLLATDLRDREIVFGKLAARVGNMTLFLLAGLPVLSLVQFFGGVDPDLLLAGFAATFITMLSLSVMSVFCSVTAKRARDAIALAYLIAFAYFAASLLGQFFRTPDYADKSITLLGRTVTAADAAYAFGVGNPVLGFVEVMESRFRGGDDHVLVRVLGHFALFHGLLMAGLLAWSIFRLRAVALRQSYGAVGGKKAERAARARRELKDDPVFWKEVFVESGLKMSFLGRAIVLLIAAGSFVPVFIIAYENFIESRYWGESPWRAFSRDINSWVRAAGTCVTCLVLLATAVRGASCVSGERDRQTLDSLLTTTLSARQILWGKWWGCMLGLRRAWVWLGLIWLIGLVTGGLHPLAVPFMALAVGVYASAYAWLGIWYSLVSTTTLRATLNAIMTGLFVGGGYFVVFAVCCLMPLSFLVRGPGGDFDTLLQLFSGFSPAVVSAWLPMYDFDWQEVAWIDRGVPFVPFAVLGLVVWGAASRLLARAALQRFREQANRTGR